MLKYFMQQAQNKAFLYRPDLLISLPCKVTEYEKRAVQEVGRALGAGRVHLVDEPMAAAVGAGLAVTQPRGQIIVDIGGGTTEIAVISLGGVTYANAVRVGGHEMDARIAQALRHQFNILIGEPTAEQLKILYADALYDSAELMEFKGVNLYNGLPKICTLPKGIIHQAIEPVVENIVQATKQALSQTPPELSADIAEQGIWLAGGGALIKNLPERLSAATGLKVSITREPLFSVARGGAYLLEHPELLEKVS
jgi:rod shape-determining protein MreB